MLLSLETATDVCSVALHEMGGRLLAAHHLYTDRSHADRLSVLVEQLFSNAGISATQLSGVAISEGPGSYTGLRIGTSLAKGICYALDIPLLAVPTLAALAQAARSQLPEQQTPAYFIPLLDARRMEVYTAVFDQEGQEQQPVAAQVLAEDCFVPWLTRPAYFFGDGLPKSRPFLEHPNAHLLPSLQPTAEAVGLLALQKYAAGDTADLAYFEPFYLKAFKAIKPRQDKLRG